MSLLLTGGTVVRSIAPPVVDPGDLLVEDGRIALVGAVGEPTERIDCTGCLIVPGNVCAHTHLYSALARGMPYRLEPPRSFMEILQRVWWRLDRALDETTIRASALAGGMEALLAGTTTLIDHHASPAAVDGSLDIIADALAGLGIRSVLCYETSDRDGPDVARAGLAENDRFLAAVAAGRYPLARGMVGAHASFTLSDGTMEGLATLAASGGSVSTSMSRRTAPTSVTRWSATSFVSRRGLPPPASWMRARCSPTASTSITARSRSCAPSGRRSSTTRGRT